MAARGATEHGKRVSGEKRPLPRFLFGGVEGPSRAFNVVKPRQRPLGGESQSQNHVDARGFLSRIGVRTAGYGGCVGVRVKPVGEATRPRTSVGGEHVVGPILRQVVNGVGIPSVDDVCFFDDVPLALEQTRVHLIALEVRIHLFAMRAIPIDVNADKDLVRQSLKRPPNQGLEHLTGHVNLSQITGSLSVGIVIVGGHQILQPRLHHDPPKQMTVKRPAEDNL